VARHAVDRLAKDVLALVINAPCAELRS